MSFSKPTDLRVLLEMLTRRRPAGSKTERRFIREYIKPLGVQSDAAGNLYKRIGSSPVLWSCHTDTVHREGGTQLVVVDSGVAKLSPKSTSNCLGADDTAGVWLMREMILAGVPGLYVFHRGEEIGGTGSSYIAARTPQLLNGIQCAIALDRAGRSSVITHQGGRCCSDDFARSLVGALAAVGVDYEADDTGVFTDTANYVDLIGECTNLSVGYFRQHHKDETLDLAFIVKLRAALIALDQSTLVYARKPGEYDIEDYGGSWGFAYGDSPQQRMSDMVADYPEEVSDILQEFGLTADTLWTELYERGAVLRRR